MPDSPHADRIGPVAVVGLGRMGSIYASRLVAAGVTTHAFDVDTDATRRLGEVGAVAGSSVGEVAKAAEVTILSLPTPAIVEDVVGEALRTGPANPTIVDMSTIDPATSIRLHGLVAEHGGSFLEAPVSGSVMKARDGALTIMVGGSPETLERCEPILRVLGSNIVHLGGPGTGQTTKLCNNAIVTVTLCALAESLLTGVKAGLDARELRSVICKSSGASWLLENWLASTSFAGDYSPLFALELLQKDASLFEQASDELGVPTPVTSVARQMLGAAAARGLGDRDMTAVVQLYEELADVALLSQADSG